ncbi:hypothetical protein [Vibrio sp. FJH11]
MSKRGISTEPFVNALTTISALVFLYTTDAISASRSTLTWTMQAKSVGALVLMIVK